MPRRATPFVAVALTGVALAAAASPAAAAPKPGVFAGSIGVAVPAHGVAVVRAVNRASGVVAAARRVGRGGRFTLTLPPGAYAVGASLVSPTARPAKLPFVGLTLKAGQRRTKVSLKNARRKKRRGRASFVQELGQVTPGRLAVAIPYFTGLTDVEGQYFQKGLADMLTTDLVGMADGSTPGGGRCRYAVREINRIAEAQAEIDLSNSRYGDPGTRIKRNWVIPDVMVRGTLKQSRAPLPVGQKINYDVRLVDGRTGAELGRVTGALPMNDWSPAEEDLARRLSKAICDLSDVYDVKLDLQGIGIFATHDGSGTLHATLHARRSPGTGGGQVWRDSGTLTWGELSFTSKTPPCVMTDPIPGVQPWSVTIIDAGGGELQVTWLPGDAGPAGNSTASIDCPPGGPHDPDPPPVPGLPGPSLLGIGPMSFTVPYAGGVQSIAGGVVDGGYGFTNSGTITVTPAGVSAPSP